MKTDEIPKYLIHIVETSKNEFEEIQNSYKKNNDNQVPIKIDNLPLDKDTFSKIEYQPISSSNNLRVTSSIDIGNLSYCNTVYYLEESGNYTLFRIEPLQATNNTDPTGPKVQQPLNQSVARNYLKCRFRKLTLKELLAAENNVKKSNNQKKDKYFYPVVAILDTGIDLGAFRQSIKSRALAPLHLYKDPFNNNEKVIGRNFFNEGPYGRFPNEPFDNDGFTKHGTRVAKLIAEITENKVRIMSLKTANHNGIHNLIDIYSAFEYILKYNETAEENDKVKIINASWSFKSDCRPFIFEYYLKKLLADGVTFVTTAGNENKVIGTQIQLYPAIFNDTNNILVVGDNSNEHGTSKEYVNCCVNGIKPVPRNLYKEGYFKDVLNKFNVNDKDLYGTSFAAAIYSGYLVKSDFGPGNMLGTVSTLYPADYPY